MQRILRWLPAFLPLCLSAQGIRLQPGSHLIITGSPQLILNNTSLYNSGEIVPGNSSILFSGTSSTVIGGDQPITFNQLTIASPETRLDNDIVVGNNITLQTGHLDLNSHTLDLGATGMITGEREEAFITGTTGGTIIIKAWLNAPQAVNPGNIGVSLTSSANLGWTTITRGHTQTLTEGIHRFFDIAPEINANLQATLRFYYLDGELNGNPKSSLNVFTSQQLNSWQPSGSNSRNANYVESSNISQLHKYTLAVSSEAAKLDAQIFPNPFHDRITIALYSEKTKTAQLRLMDQKGNYIKSREIACNAGANTITWDIGDISPGVYYVLFEGPASGTIKLIKQ
jgi:hypothetical protein